MKKIYVYLVTFFFAFSVSAKPAQLVVYFDSNKYTLSDSEIQKLSMMQFDTSRSILVSGYTDNDGDKEHNIWLSQKRAERVRDYLFIKKNIPLANITVIGFGEDKTNLSNALQRRSELSYSSTDILAKKETSLRYPTEVNLEDSNVESTNEKATEQQISDAASQKRLINLEQRVKDLESMHSNTTLTDSNANTANGADKSEPENETDDEEDVSKAKNHNNSNSWFDGYSFQLKLNSYSADQSASFGSGASINEILSDPRLSIELDIIKPVNKNTDLIHQIGIRWNEYSEDLDLSIAESWTGLAFKTNTGFAFKHYKDFYQKIDLGFEQMLSHTVDGLGIIDLELQPIVKFNYLGLFKVFQNSKFNLEIGPKLGYLYGISDIEAGYSFGLSFKSSIGVQRKYFVYGLYENNNFDQDIRDIEVETLELGFGFNF